MQSSADVLKAEPATTERVKVLVPFGFTERQARFLANVMLHSGVFVGRQYLTVLSVVLRTAVDWGVITRVPCSIKLLKAPKGEASFHDFDDFERLVDAARSEALALLVVLLGGEAGLRCGEIIALEWNDIEFAKRQLTVARSEWKGHVTLPKGGRLRYVPMTRRLTEALRQAGHLRGPRVLCDETGKPLTRKVIQVLVRRTARRANVKPGIQPGSTRCGDPAIGDRQRNEPRGRGEMVEAAGTEGPKAHVH